MNDLSWAEKALDRAVKQLRLDLPLYKGRCRNHSSVNGIYPAVDNVQWTCGFWPGELWLAWEHSRDDRFKDAAMELTRSFERRILDKIEVDHHDMGFLYTPSCVAAWKLTGDKRARNAAVLAADQLLTRYQPGGGFLQAWGPMNAPDNYRFIIDCLLNLPLLYWASEVTGERKYERVAWKHTATCFQHSFRPDGSTFHTFYMNPDGTPNRGETCQGYRADSAWARGQAWGVYGSVLSYRYTKKPVCIDLFLKSLQFYLSRLPEDMVPYWDLIFSDGSGEPRDSSSAAIAACALLEAAEWLPEAAESSRGLAARMLKSLSENYTPKKPKAGMGLLLHGTYSKKSPYNTCTEEGVDESTSWGDYFYMEALTRLTKHWTPYW